jgi:XTP/dITP diphosphohydrolase
MLKFITTNEDKINSTIRNLRPYNIEFEILQLELKEIQSESIIDIAEDKADQAYEMIKEPLLISDHGWFIPALNGFPGAYMKYMNQWLEPQDFLALMKNKKDKSIIKQEVLCYKDAKHLKTFSAKLRGRFINKIYGEGLSAMRVVSLLPSGKSVAECIKENIDSYENNPIWEEFATWYKKTAK